MMKPLSTENFVALVQEAMAEIPPAFAPYMRDVTVDIEPMPDEEAAASVGLSDPRHLLGLYRGTPMTQRSVEQNFRLPDRITIYQRNIERICRTNRQIVAQVRKTVLHEVGHHFGLDEVDLDELGYG